MAAWLYLPLLHPPVHMQGIWFFNLPLKKEEAITARKDIIMAFIGVPDCIQSTFWAPGNIKCRSCERSLVEPRCLE